MFGLSLWNARRIALISVLAALAVPVAGYAVTKTSISGRANAQSVASTTPTTKGSSSGPLLSEFNTGSGEGIDGQSNGNYGIVGRTNLISTSTKFAAGTGGVDETTGSSRSYNYGTFGTSQNGIGVLGQTAFNGSPAQSPTYGVAGVDNSTAPTDGTSQQSGVYGTSTFGYGSTGISYNYVGVYGQTGNSTTSGSFGVLGDDANTSDSSENVGVYGQSGSGYGIGGSATSGFGAYGSTVSGAGGEFLAFGSGTALSLGTYDGGPAMTANNGTKEIMSLDSKGNLRLAGTLVQKTSPLILHSTQDGSALSAHLTETTESTIEDYGEARLIRGRALVPLESRFAKTIEASAGYLVFITPEGLTAGQLCVVARTANAFEVVESGVGSSTLFAYRIVAHPRGETLARLESSVVRDSTPHLRALPRRNFTRVQNRFTTAPRL